MDMLWVDKLWLGLFVFLHTSQLQIDAHQNAKVVFFVYSIKMPIGEMFLCLCDLMQLDFIHCAVGTC